MNIVQFSPLRLLKAKTKRGMLQKNYKLGVNKFWKLTLIWTLWVLLVHHVCDAWLMYLEGQNTYSPSQPKNTLLISRWQRQCLHISPFYSSRPSTFLSFPFLFLPLCVWKWIGTLWWSRNVLSHPHSSSLSYSISDHPLLYHHCHLFWTLEPPWNLPKLWMQELTVEYITLIAYWIKTPTTATTVMTFVSTAYTPIML